jgi:hypothetical protein
VSAADPSTYDVDPGRGWIMFAGSMLALGGTMDLIYGIAAVGNSHVFVRGAEYVIGDLKTWGWLRIAAGVALLVIAFGVWAATEWGRWLGVLATALNMLLQFVAFPSQPAVAVVLFFVNVIVLYGLLTYGGADRRSLSDWH